MRDPSLHIKRSDLINIISTLLPDSYNHEIFVDRLIKLSAPHSVSSRSIHVPNNRIEKKVNKLIQSSRLDGDMFSNLLYLIRKKLRHVGVTQAKPGSKDWEAIKECAANAIEFCSEFDLEKKAGFQEYIKIGISKMKIFNIRKFPSLHEQISNTYQAMRIVKDDDEPEFTEFLYKEYSSTILTNTGIFEDMKSDPEKYSNFVLARKQAKKLNVALDLYMEAQFDGLSFTNGIPHPHQLHGVKATERLYKYLYKQNIKA